jgi:hypothetical protein
MQRLTSGQRAILGARRSVPWQTPPINGGGIRAQGPRWRADSSGHCRTLDRNRRIGWFGTRGQVHGPVCTSAPRKTVDAAFEPGRSVAIAQGVVRGTGVAAARRLRPHAVRVDEVGRWPSLINCSGPHGPQPSSKATERALKPRCLSLKTPLLDSGVHRLPKLRMAAEQHSYASSRARSTGRGRRSPAPAGSFAFCSAMAMASAPARKPRSW